MAKAPVEIRSLARAQRALAIRTLTGVCGSKAAPAAARVSAASALLDRGYRLRFQPFNPSRAIMRSTVLFDHTPPRGGSTPWSVRAFAIARDEMSSSGE